MGTVGGNLFAPNPYGDFTVALLALDAVVSVQGGFGARDVPIEEFLQSRERQAGTLVLSVSCQKPLGADAFRYRKIARIKPKGGSVITLAAHLPVSSGRVLGARIALGSMAPIADPRQGGRTRPRRTAARCFDHRRRCVSGGRRHLTRAITRSPAAGTGARSSASISDVCCPVRNRIVMAKTALQFRHNGRDVAIFVDGGTNLLVALRELIGDMTPKFGCGQGGCGACSVLIDGELHLSCLTLAETVAGRSVRNA